MSNLFRNSFTVNVLLRQISRRHPVSFKKDGCSCSALCCFVLSIFSRLRYYGILDGKIIVTISLSTTFATVTAVASVSEYIQLRINAQYHHVTQCHRLQQSRRDTRTDATLRPPLTSPTVSASSSPGHDTSLNDLSNSFPHLIQLSLVGWRTVQP